MLLPFFSFFVRVARAIRQSLAAWRRRGQSHMKSLFVLFVLPIGVLAAVKCAQCTGWHGKHPLDSTVSNNCDNRNNQCQTDQFCVKIVDPMAPHIPYTTYKSDCWFQTTIQVTPSNLSNVIGNSCYDYQDASVPTKRWKYCFCSDKDYCNSSSRLLVFLAFVMGLLQL